MQPQDEELPVLYGTVGVLEVQGSGPDGLDLRPRQLDTRFIRFLHIVIMMGLPVLGGDFHAFLFHCATSLGEIPPGFVKA